MSKVETNEVLQSILLKIKDLDKRTSIVEGKIQSISSVLMNKRKHQKS